ncbi:MAG: glycosyltransferase family 4 protein [Lachnospiraceae bacterium]|nr:glycosyltransferase family 4 protein [Lachnospiraceae bacterium]
MRLIQMLTIVAFGDAISNHSIALRKRFEEAGVDSRIYAEAIDERVPEGIADTLEHYTQQEGDIILYHFSTGHWMNRKILEYDKAKLYLDYHNITPEKYYIGYNKGAVGNCISAREDLRFLSDKVVGCISDSAYNRRELSTIGFKCPSIVGPILISYEDYNRTPDEKVIKQYAEDDFTNVLFVGRIVPNKRFEDVIEAFAYYQKYYNERSRLFLVGTAADTNLYYDELVHYVNRLHVKNVIFPGHISFPAILAYYRSSDLFLCMSDHEGFCVPLVESMYFRIPIVAFDSSAVGDTLGGGGILLKEKDPLKTAGVMHYVLTHPEVVERIKEAQASQLDKFNREKVFDRFRRFLIDGISEENESDPLLGGSRMDQNKDGE